MITSTVVVSLDQIRAVLESNTTNAHAEVILLEKPLLAETLIKHVAIKLKQPNYLV